MDDDEVDLTPAAKHVADLVVSGNRPCVLGMRGWTQGNMTRFWIDFASTVFNGESGELYFVVDEVHNFAPKGKLQSIDAGKCLHWTNRIMNEGRGIGMVNLIASQRPQKVHNDTLTACETLVAMRVIHKADRDAVEDWIKGCGDTKQGAEVLNTLAGMKRGEAFVWSPEAGFGPQRLAFPMFETFDSFAPARLQQKVKEEGWASVDLTEVRQKLAAVIEKAKAEDPKELRKQIADLQKQLKAKAPVQLKPVETIKEVEKLAIKEPQIKRLESFAEKLVATGSQLVDVAKEITGALAKVSTNGHKPVAPIAQRPSQVSRTLPERKPAQPRQVSEFAGQLPIGEEKILAALIQYPNGLDRNQLTVLTGYKRSTRDAYIQRLGEKGFVRVAGKVFATDEGIAALPNYEPLPTGEALQMYWYDRLPEGERAILGVLIEAYPQSVDRESLTETTGYKRSTRDAYIQRLASKELVVPGRGEVTASENLFL